MLMNNESRSNTYEPPIVAELVEKEAPQRIPWRLLVVGIVLVCIFGVLFSIDTVYGLGRFQNVFYKLGGLSFATGLACTSVGVARLLMRLTAR
jgi:hypothetical protein